MRYHPAPFFDKTNSGTMKASELKKGMVFQVDGRNVMVREIQVQSPSSRSGSTLYKVKGRDVVSRQKYESAFKGEEMLQDVDLERRAAQFLYADADSCTFMDIETYEQYVYDLEAVEDERPYLIDGLEGIYALIVDEAPLAIELPASVVLEITDCAPGMKGATAVARNKPATLSTGLVVQVPEYMTVGEQIKVNTLTGEFISRA